MIVPGKLNIIGVVDNNGEFPVDATVGVNVTEVSDNEDTASAHGSSNSTNLSFSTLCKSYFCESDLSRNWSPI